MSLEFNKVAAAVLTAGVVAMFSGFIGRELFHVEHLEEPVYKIASVTGETSGGGGEKPAEEKIESVLPLLASADVAHGQTVFKACAACHDASEGGPNKVGPNLWGVVGRPHAAHEGFAYSDALKAFAGKPWSYDEINHFIANPKHYAPGTKMTFAGLKKVQDRADVIAYLRTLAATPEPLPTQEEIDAVQKAEAEAAQPAEQTAAAGSTDAGGSSEAAASGSEGTQTADAGGGDLLGAIGAADPAQGEKLFGQCKACHTIEKGGPNKIGPNLWGVVAGPVAHKDDFNYSDALKAAHAEGKTWTYENLEHWLTSPKDFIPGNKMTFAGLKKPEQRAAMIAYLRSMADSPAPLE
jgi:cytochrome c